MHHGITPAPRLLLWLIVPILIHPTSLVLHVLKIISLIAGTTTTLIAIIHRDASSPDLSPPQLPS